MMTKVRAVYRNGLLRPLIPVDWPEDTVLELLAVPVQSNGDEAGSSAEDTGDGQTLAEILGFDPGDEKKLAEMAESQYRAMREIVGIFSSDTLSSEDDIDAILYS